MKEIIKKAMLLEPSVRIGKDGITYSTVKEVEKLLKKRKLIKVKFLKTALEKSDKKEIAKQLAAKTKSSIIQQVGFVVVLYRDEP